MNKSMSFVRPLVIGLVTLIVFIVAAFGIAGLLGGERDLGAAPDFTAQIVDGSSIRLSDNFEKKGTILCFYETGNEACDQLLQTIKSKAQDRYGENLDIIVVATDAEKTTAQIAAYMKQKQVLVEHLVVDTDASISSLYRISAKPITYFINQKGSVRASALGTLTEETVAKYIKMI